MKVVSLLLIICAIYYISVRILRLYVNSSGELYFRLFFIFQLTLLVAFRLYLPKVPDDAMFSGIIESGVVANSHLGTLDVIGYFYITKPIAFLVGNDVLLFSIIQKAIVCLSVLLLFSSFVLFKSGEVGNICKSSNTRFLKLFLIAVCIYPSFFINYNNVLRESWELLFFSLSLYCFFIRSYFLSIWGFLFLCVVRNNSVIYLPFLLSVIFFKRIKNKETVVPIVAFVCLVILFFIPHVYDLIINYRLAKTSFFISLGFGEYQLYPIPEQSQFPMIGFVFNSLFQYVLDPLNINLHFSNATLFMYLEAGFSILLLYFTLMVCYLRKKISLVVLLSLSLIFVQSLFEYFIEGGMRHRLLPYMLLICNLAYDLSSVRKGQYPD